MTKELFKLAKAFETMTDELDLSSRSEDTLKSRLIQKLQLTAQDMSGPGGIDPYTQQALQAMIDPTLKVDGDLGHQTRAAIAAFRKDRGIPATTSWGDVQRQIVKEYQDGSYVKNTTISVPAPKNRVVAPKPSSQSPYLAIKDDSRGDSIPTDQIPQPKL